MVWKKKTEPKAIPKPVNIIDVVKQGMVQMKYEEIGSWLAAHKTPLFYAHKEGLSVVDLKYIDTHPKLKAELDKMIKDIQKKAPLFSSPKSEKGDIEYIG